MKRNIHQKYYTKDLRKLISFLIPKRRTVKKLTVKSGVLETTKLNKKYDYLVLNNLVGDLIDVQKEFFRLHKLCSRHTRIIITYYNHLWEPTLKFASFLGLREADRERNWLDKKDFANLLNLAGFDVIGHQQRMLLPINLGFVSEFINRWIGSMPFINELCLTTWVIARPRIVGKKDFSVSIIVPARNEEGNIFKIIKSIPKFGKWQEIIFIEGHSVDETWKAIEIELKKEHQKHIKVSAYKQRGKGKADAVRLGFKKAKGDVLMILDADLTVNPKELHKFYKIIVSGEGEFVNGSRMVYPMEKQAMQTLNKLGNKIFGMLFSYILGQRFKDTLCGTKVLLKKDYEKIARNRKFFGEFDPFGDFDLIFGAIKQNLKVVEVPIRYRERVYGSTNISRFKHGWLLLKMTWFGFKKFKAW